MPKKPQATLLIEMSEHGIDYTLNRDDIDLVLLVVDYETEHYERQDLSLFDGHEAVVNIEFPVKDPERVEAAERAHGRE